MRKLILIIILLISVSAKADMLPKPEMIFTFEIPSAQQFVVDPNESEQIQCEDNQCLVKKPLGDYGLQQLYCKNTENCFSLAYKYLPYQKLIITTTDGKIFESNVFLKSKKLRSKYSVKVKGDKLIVNEIAKFKYTKSLFRSDFLLALFLTIILEFLAIMLVISPNKPRLSIILPATLVNFITVPLAWFFFPLISFHTSLLIVSIWLLEAFFIFIFNRHLLTFRKCMYYSFITNTTSLTVGMIIFFSISTILLL